MQIKLHANASTTPKIRLYIKQSSLPVSKLAKELGIAENTVRKWRARESFEDRSHARHNLGQSTSPEEEEIIIELRQKLWLSLNDIVEVMRRCVNDKLSRSSIYRCLRRRNAWVLDDEKKSTKTKTFDETPFGYVHIDLKYLSRLEKKESYVFVAIERTTRYVFVEVIENRRADTIAGCLQRFLEHFPGKIHTILTDNGPEFTDRFSGQESRGTPSGNHVFDKICAEHSTTHRLTKPFSPKTNGMVERFNRRIGDALKQKPPAKQNGTRFRTPREREDFIRDFVYSYNRTRLACLNYQTPLSTLRNLTELYM